MKIKIGTRKSKLAMVQTKMVINALQAAFDDIEIEIISISTKGDKIIDKPIAEFGGKGVFVSEIERALMNGEIDIAVHSAKDLPVEIASALEISAVLKRGNYRDVIVSMPGNAIENKREFVIGTGSARRIANAKRLYPNVRFKDIRGNVDTRLRKLKDGQHDAVILAAAGLERLGISDSEYNFKSFDYIDFIPAPCQGIIAVESRKNDFVTPILRKINDENTYLCFETERKVLEMFGGDCSVALGAYSQIKNGKISLSISSDGKKFVCGQTDISQRFKLAEELIAQL